VHLFIIIIIKKRKFSSIYIIFFKVIPALTVIPEFILENIGDIIRLMG